MTKSKRNSATRRSTLLAAASVLSVSLGMVATQAGANDQAGTGDTVTPGAAGPSSNQLKYENNYLKYDSNQIKGESNQSKWHSNMQKGSTQELNPQPLPPGSGMPAGHALHQKITPSPNQPGPTGPGQ